jgi:UDP-N-acetyl-D-mannosaminuronic acid transferase (WecB/TagA/CpsF family)
MRKRELLGRQVKLQRVTEGDLVRIILAAGTAFEQKLALLGDDQQLGRLAAAARKFGDRIDNPDVVMRQDDRQLLGRELFTAIGAAGAVGGGNRALDGRCNWLHDRCVYSSR